MRTVYIDEDFKCHVAGGGRAAETDFFDGKCDSFVEGYRFLPAGESWTRSDGSVFRGEMIAPWKPYDELDALQRVHERQLLAEYEALINELYEEVA